MKKIIRILSYKKVKTDKVYDIVKSVDIVYAEVNENDGRAFILGGQYNGKYLEKFDSDYENFDFTYDEINMEMLRDGKTFKNELEELQHAKDLYQERYFYVDRLDNDKIGLRICENKGIIEAYQQFQNPSVAKELGAIIENMRKNGESGFSIPANLTSRIIGNTDSLKEQDENQFKKITDYNIKEKFEQLREIVIGQDEQLKVLLANIIKNISLSYTDLDDQKIKGLKSRILIIGGTGTGKTLMVENIASMLNVPYVIEDAKRYTSNGYIGEDVENMLLNLYRAAGEDPELFKHGIIFIDEVDKLCNIKDEKSHVATTDVQEALLKFLDGSKITKTINKGFRTESLALDTTRVTFVLAGAFNNLSNDPNYDNDTILIDAGMIPELVARLNTKVVTKKPTKEELRTALVDSKYGYLKLLEEYLSLYNIEMNITEELINKIVDEAYELDQGYRSLNKVLNRIIDEYLFDILSGDIKKLTLEAK